MSASPLARISPFEPRMTQPMRALLRKMFKPVARTSLQPGEFW